MDHYNLVLEDLGRTTPTNPTITPPFYREDDGPEERIKSLTRQMRRAKSNKNRVETLLIAWYIGQILEIHADTPKKRSACLGHLTAHYAKAAVWTYYLFEFLGVEQIARTRYLTLTILTKKLGEPNYNKLKEDAAAIAGARLQEEEVVNI
jgi:hypothetical protein